MTKVQLPDLRIVELANEKKAKAYAQATGGHVIKTKEDIRPKSKLRQLWDRV